MKIKDRVAVVTGAGSGIGRAIALRLAAGGAAVVAADINAGAAKQTVRAIAEAGGRAAAVGTDVASDAAVRRMITFTEKTFGPLDILVNNAGVVEGITARLPNFPDLDPRVWNRMLDVNLRGVLLGTHYAVVAMREHGGGAIVNIASMAGFGAGPHPAPVYAASKAAIMRFSAALSPLAKSIGVRVNCVCPDWVDTPMVQRSREQMSPRERKLLIPATMAQPEDIAEAVVNVIRNDRLAGRITIFTEDVRVITLPAPKPRQ